jgi:HlyD family secretion protein
MTMSKSSSRRKTVIIVLVALVVVAAGIFILTRPKKAKYRTSAVERGDISISVSATGTLNPVNQVTVGSQVSGTVLKTYFDFNDHVKAGQVLATIDPRNYESALKQAEANLASAQATLNQDKLTAARAETLFANGLMAYSDYLQAKTGAEVDAARLLQAQASFEQAQTNLAYTTITAPMAGIVIAREVDAGQTVAASLQSPDLFLIADLSQMQVEVSIDEADVGTLDTGLTATFNVDAYPESTFAGKLVQIRNQPVVSSNVTTYTGIVRVANPGMLLKPGMTANVKIIVKAVDNVLCVANAALNPKLATTLGFTMPTARTAGRWRTSTGRDSLSAASNTARVGGRGQRRGFRAGAGPADSSRVGGPPEAMAAPAAAAAVTKTVFVLENGRPVPRRIEVGIADASNTEVISGLSEGELVVTGLGHGKSNGTSTSASQNRGTPFGFGGRPPGRH